MQYLPPVNKQEAYWDNNATTPCDPRVIEAMLPYHNILYANPSSPHRQGKEAKIAVEKARKQIAEFLGCFPEEIVFTSGATESNNIVILGATFQVLKNLGANNGKTKIVATDIEHKSILKPVEHAKKYGVKTALIPTNRYGVTTLEETLKTVSPDTILVTQQTVNSETGIKQNIKQTLQVARNNNAAFHTDITCATGKMLVNLHETDCDFASMSAHKMYGPKGIGVLYIKNGAKNFPFPTPLNGGEQEQGVRPGTHNVPAIIGFGVAAQIMRQEISENIKTVKTNAKKIIATLKHYYPQGKILNHTQNSDTIPGTLLILTPGIPADLTIAKTKTIAISKGSACNSQNKTSIAIKKVAGNNLENYHNIIRISIDHNTNPVDFKKFAKTLKALDAQTQN